VTVYAFRTAVSGVVLNPGDDLAFRLYPQLWRTNNRIPRECCH